MTTATTAKRALPLKFDLGQIEELLNAARQCDLENEDFTSAVTMLNDAREQLSGTATVAEYYLNHDPASCPSCKSRNINGDEVQIDNTTAFQEVFCMNCGAAWQDNYSLSSLSRAAGFSLDEPFVP